MTQMQGANPSPERTNQAAAAAAAQSTSEQTQETQSHQRVAGGFTMPSFEQVKAEIGQNGVLAELKDKGEEELRAAYEMAKDFQSKNALELLQVGKDIQLQLAQQERTAINNVDDTSLREFKELATKTRQAMDRLGVNDIKLRWWEKLIPGKTKNFYQSLRAKFQELAEIVDEQHIKMEEERLKLTEDYDRVEEHTAVSRQLYEQLTQLIGSQTLFYNAKKAELAALEKKYAGSNDEAKATELQDKDAELTRFGRRIQSLTDFRNKCLKASRISRALSQAYLDNVEAIDDQQTLSALAWYHAVNIGASANRVEQGAAVIEETRSQADEITEQTTEMADRALKRSQEQQLRGVSDIEKMRNLTLKVAEMEKNSIEHCKLARSVMEERNQLYAEMDQLIKNVATRDEETLADISLPDISEYDRKLNEKTAQAEQGQAQ